MTNLSIPLKLHAQPVRTGQARWGFPVMYYPFILCSLTPSIAPETGRSTCWSHSVTNERFDERIKINIEIIMDPHGGLIDPDLPS
jgi:hypothetical protein